MIKKLEVFEEQPWAISTNELYTAIRELQLKINEIIEEFGKPKSISWFPDSGSVPKTAPKDFPPELLKEEIK